MANDLLWDQLSDTVLKLDDDLSKLTDQFVCLQTHVLGLQSRALVDPLKRASGSDEAIINAKASLKKQHEDSGLSGVPRYRGVDITEFNHADLVVLCGLILKESKENWDHYLQRQWSLGGHLRAVDV